MNNIIPGKYYIKEIKSPLGYIKYDEEIEINTEFNDELTVTIRNKKTDIPKFEIKQKSLEVKKLPKTGM